MNWALDIYEVISQSQLVLVHFEINRLDMKTKGSLQPSDSRLNRLEKCDILSEILGHPVLSL